MEERKQADYDEAQVKNELLSCFLSKLKKKNKAASFSLIEYFKRNLNSYFSYFQTVQELLLQNKFLDYDLNTIVNQEEQQLDLPLEIQPRKRKFEVSQPQIHKIYHVIDGVQFRK